MASAGPRIPITWVHMDAYGAIGFLRTINHAVVLMDYKCPSKSYSLSFGTRGDGMQVLRDIMKGPSAGGKRPQRKKIRWSGRDYSYY